MAESLTIARPYAEAAFQIARDTQSLPSWSDALARLAVVASTDAARELVGNPHLSAEQVATLCVEVAGPINDQQKNLVRVLADNDRIAVLAEIAEHFERLRNEFESVLEAEVSSAYPLDDAQLATIVASLEEKYGNKVKAHVVVDHDLIGGVSIRVGDEVMDASVRGKLAQLASTLRK